MIKINDRLAETNMIMSETGQIYHEMANRLGISDSEMNILYAIRFLGEGCTQSDISKATGISRKTINSAVIKLANEGCFKLKARDRKTVGLYLTETGEELAERTADKIIAIENDIHGSWSDRENEEYVRLNARFRDDLRDSLDKLKDGEDYER